MNDLGGDGWQIIRHDFSRTTPDIYIKATIANDYVLQNDVNAALILGHLAVAHLHRQMELAPLSTLPQM